MASEHGEGGAKKCEWNKVCHDGTHHMDATTKLSMVYMLLNICMQREDAPLGHWSSQMLIAGRTSSDAVQGQ